MTDKKLLQAVDVALETLRCNKLCQVMEDDDAYYFTACGDNGEVIYGAGFCRVEKDSLKGEICFHTDPRHFTPKTVLPFPEERSDVFVNVRKAIEDMQSGDIKSIEDGMMSSSPILVMNAIIQAVLHRRTSETIIARMKKQKENRDILLGFQIGDVATAALAVLKIEDYSGESRDVFRIISDFQKMLNSTT